MIVGNILSAGQGMNPGRQVGVKSGVSVQAPGLTLNRMRLGLQAIINVAQEIALGDAEVVLAGGIEKMDQAPFLLPKGRYGYRMGLPDAKISITWSTTACGRFQRLPHGHHRRERRRAVRHHLEIRDAYAARSHQLAPRPTARNFAGQIVPVPIKQKKQTVDFTTDEHVRPDSTAEGLARLRPVFKKDGLVTAGNASGINDGAAMMLVTSAANVGGVRPAGQRPAGLGGGQRRRPGLHGHRHGARVAQGAGEGGPTTSMTSTSSRRTRRTPSSPRGAAGVPRCSTRR